MNKKGKVRTMIKFGTGGWRAVIADEFTKENIRLVTAGLCRLMELEGHGILPKMCLERTILSESRTSK